VLRKAYEELAACDLALVVSAYTGTVLRGVRAYTRMQGCHASLKVLEFFCLNARP